MTTLIVRRPFRPSLFMTPRLSWEIVTPRTRNANVALNVSEDAEGYTVQATLPGINPADLDINLEKQTLTIKGEFAQAEAAEGTRYHLRERGAGQFERSLQFPVAINGETVTAAYEHGILTLRLPKAEAAQPRKIAVQPAPAIAENKMN